MNKKDDIETILWNKLKKGHIHGFEGLYDLFIDDLYTYGIKQLNNKDCVMDCIHDLFVDLYKYKANLSQTDNVKAYLFKSLKRKINRRHLENKILVDEDVSEISYKLNKNYAEPWEKEIIKAELISEKQDWLLKALNKLSKKQKKAIFLKYNQEKTYEEIAETMGVSVATSRTIVYRAIKILRKSLLLVLSFFNFF